MSSATMSSPLPSDIAAMITFLASGAAGWITGQTYRVNGGFSVNL